MKSILVIDMPRCCANCPCLQQDDLICRALNEELFVTRDEEPIKSARCPLKPMPEKRTMYIRAKTDIEFAEYYARLGWNACIEEIEQCG